MTMRIPVSGRQCLVVAGIVVASALAMAVEAPDEMRRAAGVIASVEGPLGKGDVGGYCSAMYGSPDYLGYLARVCEAGVRNKLRKPDDCTPETGKIAAKREMAQCAAMPSGDFEAVKNKWREARGAFVKEASSKGFDGEQLLSEEQAKRR